MYQRTAACPFCQQVIPVYHWGTNESGTKRYRCTRCQKCFTEQPRSNRLTPEKEQLIERALEERLSIEATARLLKVAKKTIYKVLKKRTALAADQMPMPQQTVPTSQSTQSVL